MNRITTALAATALLGLAGPAAAFDMGAMSDAERAQFRAEVRAYLMEHPEVLMEAVSALESRQAEADAAAKSTLVAQNAEALFSDGHSWVGGNPQGDITMVEFFDYRCGYCRKAFSDVETLVGSDGNIRFILKEFPILGPDSVASSRFAIATRQLEGDAAYKKVHDALMNLGGTVNEAALRRVGRAAGIDADAAIARMNAPEVTAEIDANRALAQKMAIGGTPTFILGDRILPGYVPLDGMKQMVATERNAG